MGNYYAGAYWGARKESSGDCASRLLACLNGLAAIDQSLLTWYKKGSTKSAASQVAVDTSSREALVELLGTGQNRRDIGGAAISELGFNVALWNHADEPTSFRVTCGSYIDNPAIKNTFNLQLPELSERSNSLGNRESAIAVVKVLANTWMPDWATWANREWRSVQKIDSESPVFGSATYIAHQVAVDFRFPGLTVEQFGEGVLLVLDSDHDDIAPETFGVLQEAFLSHKLGS